MRKLRLTGISTLQTTVLFLSLSLTAGAFAQAAAPETNVGLGAATYDVVSITPNLSGSKSITLRISNGNLSATNIPLGMLLAKAYGIKQEFIYGLVGTAASERFDINARATGANIGTTESRSLMLRRLLADHFQLQIHEETKALPVYEMSVAASGIKFNEAVSHDAAAGMRIGNNQVSAHEISMEWLAKDLTDQLHRQVIDNTGLTGKYDLDVGWPQHDALDVGFQGANQDQHDSSLQDHNSQSIVLAFEQQLGLKLKSSIAPVKTLVVDHVEMVSN